MRACAVLFALCAVVTSNGAFAAACEDTRYLADRSVVIEPCTRVLATPGLPDERRVRALEYRARGLIFAEKFEDAEADIEAGLRIALDDGALHRVRSILRRHRGDYQGAWDDGLVAIRQLPNEVHSYVVLIDVALVVGEADTARELIEHALTVDPGDFSLIVWRARYHERKQEYVEAAAAIEEALNSPRERDREHFRSNWYGRTIGAEPALRLSRGGLLAKATYWEAAAKIFDEVVAARADAITLAERADFHLERPTAPGERSWLPAALADADAALAVDPSYHRAHRTRALILRNMRRPKEALSAFDEAVRLDPSIADYLWMRGRIWRSLGDHERAAEDFLAYAGHPYGDGTLLRQKLTRLGYLREGPRLTEEGHAIATALQACARDERC